ncbi:MAG: hypothetical protein QNI91_01715 [Arenicellales bacterium]|nr:hypothetical protein [Arenicellales bacterium]
MLQAILRAVAFALLAVSAAALSGASTVLKLYRTNQTAARQTPDTNKPKNKESSNQGGELQDLIKEVQHCLNSQPDT